MEPMSGGEWWRLMLEGGVGSNGLDGASRFSLRLIIFSLEDEEAW